MGTFGFFKYMVMVSFFWSFFITTIISTLPATQLTTTDLFSGVDRDMNSMAQQLDVGVANQKNLPATDIGALVYYSGIYLIDLMVNFFAALPQMVGLAIRGIFLFVPTPVEIQRQIVLVIELIVAALYVLNFIALLANMRSSGGTIA